MRVAVAWPRPRKARWRLGVDEPARSPDLSDAVLGLEAHGVSVSIEDSSQGLLNPLAKLHELYSGMDPARATRVVARRRRYDAVICVGESTALSLVWLRERLGLRFPIILIDPALGGDYARREKVLRYVLPRVNRVVVFGRAQLAFLREHYGDAVRADFMYHRIDADFYAPGLNVEPDPYVFSVGNDRSRDFETLAAAVGQCRRECGFSRRVVVQSTLQWPHVPEARLEVRTDFVWYDRLRELYRGAAMVIVPLFDMIHAGGINALLEAMAMGKPIVVSDSAGIRDYVEPGTTALTVPPGDADALARAIVQLDREPALAATLGANARRWVETHCTVPIYAAQLARILREVVSEGERARRRS